MIEFWKFFRKKIEIGFGFWFFEFGAGRRFGGLFLGWYLVCGEGVGSWWRVGSFRWVFLLVV